MDSGICGTLGAIQNQATSLLGLALRKIIQLQRLAQLLVTSGVGIPLPNINGLLALSQIGPATYNQLRAACPLLGLPPLNTQSLDELISAVRSAYQQLQNDLMIHPFASLAGLDDQLNEVLNKVEGEIFKAIGPGISMLQCLNALCNSGAAISATAKNAVNTFQQTTSASNYATVLNGSMKAQVGQYQTIGKGLSSLLDVPTTTSPTTPSLSSVKTPFSQDPAYAPVAVRPGG